GDRELSGVDRPTRGADSRCLQQRNLQRGKDDRGGRAVAVDGGGWGSDGDEEREESEAAHASTLAHCDRSAMLASTRCAGSRLLGDTIPYTGQPRGMRTDRRASLAIARSAPKRHHPSRTLSSDESRSHDDRLGRRSGQHLAASGTGFASAATAKLTASPIRALAEPEEQRKCRARGSA